MLKLFAKCFCRCIFLFFNPSNCTIPSCKVDKSIAVRQPPCRRSSHSTCPSCLSSRAQTTDCTRANLNSPPWRRWMRTTGRSEPSTRQNMLETKVAATADSFHVLNKTSISHTKTGNGILVIFEQRRKLNLIFFNFIYLFYQEVKKLHTSSAQLLSVEDLQNVWWRPSDWDVVCSVREQNSVIGAYR